MANLNVQRVTAVGGTAITFVAASAGGDRVPAGSNMFLLVRNGGGSTITVTLDVPGTTFNAAATPDTAITVAAAAETMIPVSEHYRSTDGRAGVTYSGVTSVTVAALSV